MHYQLIIIGGGPAGYTAAIRAAQLGLKTALVERNALGGTCLNRGCVPTKALLHCAEVYETVKSAAASGVTAGEPTFDFAAMHARKGAVVTQLREGVAQLMSANGIDVLHGTGVATAPGNVSVGDEGYTCDNILIAAGSIPSVPPIEGSTLSGVVTSDHLLEGAPSFPQSLAIIGGGVIGIEMACLYSSLGCKVTVIEALDRILPLLDKEIAQNLSMILKKRGIEIFTSASVKSIDTADGGLRCSFVYKDACQTVTAERVLISTGRKPNMVGLFDGPAPELNGRFIKVDDRFETSIPGIYAVGDVIGGMQLAHEAEEEGQACVEIIAGIREGRHDAVIPSCVYTNPEIASVGLTQDDCKNSGIAVKIGKYIMGGNAKTIIEQAERSFIKLIFAEEGEKLIGAQLMCPRATDIIGELTLAVTNGLTLTDILSTCHPHPTFTEGVAEAAAIAAGRPVNTAPAKRLGK